jgi:hypothetical protein
MTMYRVAMQVNTIPNWQWKSSVLGTLGTLFAWLRLYRMIPLEYLRVFSAVSHDDFNEQLMRVNHGLASTSVPAANFLQERGMSIEGLTGVTPERKIPEYRNTKTPAVDSASAALSNKSTSETFPLYEQGMSSIERQRVAIESGVGGDHNTPYKFAFPSSVPQIITWLHLVKRFQCGDLQP